MAYEFYYDRVLKNPNLTFRLVGERLSEDVSSNTTTIQDLNSEPEVILKDIIRSPIQVAVNHNYAYGGNDLTNISQNWNVSVSQWKISWESFKTRFKNIFGQINENWIRSPADFLQIVNGSDFYKVFTGTEISIPFTFECRLYSRRDDEGELVTPIEQLNKVLEYFVGVSGSSKDLNGSDSETGGTVTFTDGTQSESLFKWYTAPHGYIGLASDNFTPKGTLSLFYGRTAVIDNLLLSNFNFTYSREMLRVGDASQGPLYIDLSFSLIPAIIFTVEDLKSIVSLNPGDADSQRLGYEGSKQSLVTGWN